MPMKKFIAIYHGAADENQKNDMDEVAEKDFMEALGTWMEHNGVSLVEVGAPLGKTKRIDGEGVSDTKNDIVAYDVVQAESHDAAAALFLDHPHLALFQGNSIELLECLSIPDMPA